MAPGRRGVTFAEIVVMLAILGVLAAILIPSVTQQLRRGQAAALADQLNNLRTAIVNYHENVNRYPTALVQLTTALVNGDQDICGGNLPPPNRNAWRGPYLAQVVLPTGVPVGDFLVQNDLVRDPLTNAGAAQGVLQINVSSVPITIAADLDKQFDGDSVYTTGTILWNSGTGVLTFQVQIRNC